MLLNPNLIFLALDSVIEENSSGLFFFSDVLDLFHHQHVEP